MKKFLSLALALIMTLSLVTISAGAAEYNDFTDKDEIQYEEAVAVLNRLGIITGYSEGDFRPEGELTRGAAAKIIVSLLIGPEAAEALPTTGNPYPDVPAGNVFAGYIGFCKTSGIISGYKDGTFRPNGTLTGYAFSKMLLGALGYKDEFEGLSGDGWTMNVANLGNAAGLFKRIDFKGGDTVNRETACLLALNTLKATMVQYTGGMNITTDAGSMVVNPTRTYVTSNQDYATHISNRKASQQGNATSDQHYTVEFGEEKFRDLRMDKDHNGADDFGRPSNVWSYKKVTIGTYPIEPDFVYTTQVTHNVDSVTDATKERALGLSGYDTETSMTNTELNDSNLNSRFTTLYVNGSEQTGVFTEDDQVAKIADYTDNGTLVEVYVSDEDADFITDVVVVKTQLMQVKRVGSDYVSLELYDGDPSDAKGTEMNSPDGNGEMDDALYGYNQNPIDVNVNDVEVGDACYNDLKDMKAGDIVAVIPQTSTTNAAKTVKYDVAKVYVPETVTGSLDRVDTYGTVNKGPNATKVTVGGTEYNIALWNKDLYNIDGDSIKVTKKDVTLYLDEYGNAMLATDVGATTNYMVIGNYRQGLVNSQIITYANGWDINGNEVSLNIGAGKDLGQWKTLYPIGSLVRYSSDASSNTADWELDKFGVFDVDALDANNAAYEIKTSNSRVRLKHYPATTWEDKDKDITTSGWASQNVWADSGIKFIYISMDSDKEVDSIEFKTGMQAASNGEISGTDLTDFDLAIRNAEACVSLKASNTTINDQSAVKAVVIKDDSRDASVNNLLYIARYHGSATRDNNGNVIQGYEVAMMTEDGKLEEDVVIYAERDLKIGQFARYTKSTHEEERFEPFYNLKKYTEVKRAASVLSGVTIDHFAIPANANATSGQNKNFVFLKEDGLTGTYIAGKYDTQGLYEGDGDAACLIDMRGANFYDLTIHNIDSADDLYDVMYRNDIDPAKEYYPIQLALIFNDNKDNDSFRRAYAVIVLEVSDTTKPVAGEPTVQPTTGLVRFADGLTNVGTLSDEDVTILGSGSTSVSFTLTKPDWAANVTETGADSTDVAVKYEIYVDGVRYSRGAADLIDVDTSGTLGDLVKDASKGTYTLKDYVLNPNTELAPADAKGHKVEIVITSVDWKNAVVEYQLNGNAVTVTEASSLMAMPTSTTGTGAQVKFAVTGVAATNGTYTVSGIQAKDGSDADLTVTDYSNITVGDITNYAAAGKFFRANGGEKVIVNITTTSTVTELYNITVNGDPITAGAPTNVVIKKNNLLELADRPVDYDSITLGSIVVQWPSDGYHTTAMEKGAPVEFRIGASAGTDGYSGDGIKGFKVYATLTNGTTKKDIVVDTTHMTYDGTNENSTPDHGVIRATVEGAVDLTINRVEIIGTVITKIEQTDDKTVTFTFNENITLANATKVTSTDKDDAANGIKVGAAVEGNVLTVTADSVAAWPTGTKISIASGAITGTGDPVYTYSVQ